MVICIIFVPRVLRLLYLLLLPLLNWYFVNVCSTANVTKNKEGWSQLLFDRVCQDPPAGYKHISVEQIMVADRKLWVKVSEETRSNVTAMTNGRKNVDLAIEKFSHHPDVQFRQKDHSPARAKVARSLTAKGRLGKERFRFQMDAPSNMGKETTSRSV